MKINLFYLFLYSATIRDLLLMRFDKQTDQQQHQQLIDLFYSIYIYIYFNVNISYSMSLEIMEYVYFFEKSVIIL